MAAHKLDRTTMRANSTKPKSSRRPTVREVSRPWGSFRQYAYNQKATVSLMTVRPRQRLSLQSHSHRDELYIVLDKGALVQVGTKTFRARPGDEFWIPARTRHRLGSRGPTVRVLEVAFGKWRQEDIVRYADDYARPARGER
jgi:mannose-1-phosphate guanylyltransferase/mannose-6-phosphate isomerase